MKLVTLILLVFLSFQSVGADIEFETELETDKKFIASKKSLLLSRYDELLKYFQVRLRKPLKIQILPYKRNIEFKSCARIYGPYRIYIHSLESRYSQKLWIELRQLPLG